MENIPTEFDCVTSTGAVKHFYPHLDCHLAAIKVDQEVNAKELESRAAVVSAMVRTDQAEQELVAAKLELHCRKREFYSLATVCNVTDRERQLAIQCVLFKRIRARHVPRKTDHNYALCRESLDPVAYRDGRKGKATKALYRNISASSGKAVSFVTQSDVEPEVSWPPSLEKDLKQRYRNSTVEELRELMRNLSDSIDDLNAFEAAYATRLLQVSHRFAPEHFDMENILLCAPDHSFPSGTALDGPATCYPCTQECIGRQ